MNDNALRQWAAVGVIGLAALACTMSNSSAVEATGNAAEKTVIAAANNPALTPQNAQATLIAGTVVAANAQGTLTAQAGSGVSSGTGAPQATIVSADQGTIRGSVCYPASLIPKMTIYAQAIIGEPVFEVTNAENTVTYQIAVSPGNYVVFAYPDPSSGADPSLAGGYTAAVPCGLSASCTDHGLLEVAVHPGEVISGVDVCDWYAPAGSLPPRP